MKSAYRQQARPATVGHVATTDADLMAVRLKDRIRREGTQLVWIAEDGCILAAGVDSVCARHAQGEAVIGCYTKEAMPSHIAADVDFARNEYATQAMRARA
jgi:hypothetical protein